MRASKYNQKKARWYYTGIIILLALATWILTRLAKDNPHKVEVIYSATFYPHIAKFMGRVTGLVSFSIGEILVVMGLIFIIGGLILAFIRPNGLIQNAGRIGHCLIRILATTYILFYFLWGFNYYRQDFITLEGMSAETATIDDLTGFTLEVIHKANLIRRDLKEDQNGVFVIDEDFKVLGELANEGFEGFTVGDQDLAGNYGRAKPLLISKWMSYTGITGIYFPFTIEANVNIHIPHTNIPATILHEMGHQRGFAKEEEANFIAYWAGINNPHPVFQYSGYYHALGYLLNDLYEQDPVVYHQLILEISDEIKRDMNEEYYYWKRREGKAEKVATAMNDNYLKANNQKAGVHSYNGVVKLLLAEYKSR